MGPVMTTPGQPATRRPWTAATAAAGALAGILTAAVALGVAELAAVITGPASGPVIAVAVRATSVRQSVTLG
jgi:hypothetical protein